MSAPQIVPDRIEVQTINGGQAVTLTVDGLRSCRQDDGRHLWVVGAVFAVSDPQTSLDDMSLGAHNLIGIQPITCMWCVRRYVSPSMPGPLCVPRKG
jgi:hypothetical protein